MSGKEIWGKRRGGVKGKEENTLKEIKKHIRGDFPGALFHCFKIT
jgi:hypothetical protein